MASVLATISWDFVPGSLNTLVEYREVGETDWVTPSSPTNPTTQNTYPITIENNTYYDIRLTTNGIGCGPSSTTRRIISTLDNCCPIGYTLSDNETFCFQVNETAATPPSGSENAVARNNVAYTTFGTLIMNPGYNIDGTGSFTQIPYTNAFWINGAGYPNLVGNTSDGPMNRAGIWATTVAINQQVGFSSCVTVPTDSIYYVGIGSDDTGLIRIDGNDIVVQDRAALGTFLRANGYPGALDSDTCYRFFYIYPVELTAGDHIIEMIGINTAGIFPGMAAMACEIYNLTAFQIASATSYVDMGSGLIFSSKDELGQPIQIGTGGIGYTCPSGYSLVLCDGPAYCTQTLTVEPVPCTTSTTTTTTTTL